MKTPLRLLIVADSKQAADLLGNELRRSETMPVIEWVETTAALQHALTQEPWDVILADHPTAELSSSEILEVCRHTRLAIPVLLVASTVAVPELVSLLKAGVSDFISKNDLSRLTPAVERAFAEAAGNRERQRTQDQLELLGAAVSAAANAMFITDRQGVIQWANAAFSQLSGYPPDELIGQTPRLLKSGVQPPSFYEQLWHTIRAGEVWTGEVVERRQDGSLYTVQQTITPLRDPAGSVTHFVSVHEDITQRKEIETKVEYLAYHDLLTRLPNRALFQDRLSQALVQARRAGRLVALHFLDLDHFKVINDTLGHAAGDLLLSEVGNRLTRCLRDTDSVARLGGDEFAIIQTNLASVDGAVRLAEKVLQALSQPVQLNGQEVQPTSSIGITVYPLDDPDGTRMVENADLAMYLAKAAGRNRFAFFTPALNAELQARQEVEVGLRRAIGAQELVLHYQPQVSLGNGALVGLEGLVRWHHPTRGLLFPAAFVSIAEASGLILPFTDYLLQLGCAQCQGWHLSGTTRPRLAINISAAHFRDGLLLRSVTEALASTGLEPQYLELELTETALLQDETTAIRLMQELHGLGIHLSIDDFGTGYTSLKYLKRLPVRGLKIDQSFVRNLPHDPDDAAIVRAIIGLAHELGLRVIAEGIETRDQFLFLRDLDCDEGQGYYFFRPQPPEAIPALLEKETQTVAETRPTLVTL